MYNDLIIIERKRIADFLTSYMSGRLDQQIKNLKLFENPIVCVISENIWKTFYFYHTKGKYIHRSYFGMLRSLAVDYHIPVLMFNDEDDFLRFVAQNCEEVVVDDREPKDNITSLKRRGCSVCVEQLDIGDYRLYRTKKSSVDVTTEIQRTPKTISERQENALSCADGISIKTARMLLKKAGDLASIANFDAEELMEIKGIGKKTAEKILNLFWGEYDGS